MEFFEYKIFRVLFLYKSNIKGKFQICISETVAKFIGKHLCQSLLFNKIAGSRPATLLKRRLWRMCFPVNFAKFLTTLFLTEHPVAVCECCN